MRTYRNGVFGNSGTPLNPFGTPTSNLSAWINSTTSLQGELVIWHTLTQAKAEKIISLHYKGVSPLKHPIKPVFYAPMWGLGNQ